MQKTEEQIRKIEEKIRKTPYHKGTEHHIGKLRAKLAKLREALIGASKKKKGGGIGFTVKKQGDATVVFLGFPSVGKSTLLKKLTNAKVKTASYAFTTVSVIPGMMKYKGAYIQLLDLPGIIKKASSGRGRGKEIFSVVRTADLVLLIVEIGKEFQFKKIEEELSLIGILLNKKNYDKRIYINLPAIYIINKIDLRLNNNFVCRQAGIYYLSAEKNIGLLALKNIIFRKLNLIRIYLKEKDKEIDFNKPLVVKKGTTVSKISEKISTDLAKNIKRAKIWQGRAKYPGQEISLSYKPVDETILYLF